MCQHGGHERGSDADLSGDSASVDVGTSDCGSDDECRNVGEKKESVAAAWERALGRLRSRGGGLTRGERSAQRRLAEKERSKEQGAHGRRGYGVVAGDSGSGFGQGSGTYGDTRVLFTCDMLLREERRRESADARRSSEWIGMTCDDPDDFQTLKERRWSVETEFKANEPVILWRKDTPVPPGGQNGYVRSGNVVKVVLAGAAVDDPEIRRYDLRSRSGSEPQEQYHDTRESKVVVCVASEGGHAVPWAALPELHLEAPAQARDERVASVWRVMDQPRPVKSGKERSYADVRRELLESVHEGVLASLKQARAKLQGEGRLRKAQLLESVRVLEAKSQDPPLHSELLVIPVKHVPLRVPKFDVRLKGSALRAVHAQQTMLTRMVMFHCTWCTERFPAFHPAYEPPDWLPMELLKRGASGVAACNIEVAT